MSSDTVFVTGATGFLGRRVVAALRGRGWGVVGVSRSAISGLREVGDYGDLVAPPGGAVLVHLAETRNIGAAEAAGEAHVIATTGALRRLLDQPWRHVVYASSAAVYGDRVVAPRRTDEKVEPDGIYGRAKLVCEDMILRKGGTVLRLANLFGTGMATNNVLGDVLNQIDHGHEPLTLRDLAPVRDFLWVDDAALAFVAAAERWPGGVLNVGSGRGTSVAALARAVLARVGTPERRLFASAPGGRASALVLDIADTERLLGWRPTTSLEAGLEILLRERSISPIPTTTDSRER